MPIGGGGSPAALWSAFTSIQGASEKRATQLAVAGGSGANFNALWVQGLNAAMRMEHTHFAMIHADISVLTPFWLDVLMDEMARLDLDFISATVPIKSLDGVSSCGLAPVGRNFSLYKRFTMRELAEMPETFNAADVGHSDKVLLHNNGMFVADLRKPLWYPFCNEGEAPVYYEFNEKIRFVEGVAQHEMVSEDWNFSHKLHAAGAKSAITQKVRLLHIGDAAYANYGKWGEFRNGDEATKAAWGNKHG